MNIINHNIDYGQAFDFGKTSDNYAKYRDIYPQKFYDEILSLGLCSDGQNVLDIGTGTGVIPRNMYKYGAKWTGVDISENQIRQAEKLSQNMNISYFVSSVENIRFPESSFDVVTACQCFRYFNHEKCIPKFYSILKPGGKILVLYMDWLPYEDKIAYESENLILKYNPKWNGCGKKFEGIAIPECYNENFKLIYHNTFRLGVHFTRESWHGRMKTCRGIGASLPESDIKSWEKEHIELLNKIAPDDFEILHCAAIAELQIIK